MTDSRQAAREQAIIAAYADNVPVESIADQYGVTPAEVERLAADQAEFGQTKPRCPGPVIAVALLVILTGAYQLITLPQRSGATEGVTVGGGVAMAVAAVLYALAAYGLWKGWRGAQILACIVAGLSVLTGMGGQSPLGVLTGGAILGLLLIPVSARDWFSR